VALRPEKAAFRRLIIVKAPIEEEKMKKEKLLVFVVASLVVVALMAGTGFAQGQAGASGKEPLETIKGTIDYNERLGGYFIRGVEPGGEFFIVNQNAAVLKKLKESGKTVTIEGRTAKTGAEYFAIEKIDGKKYSAGRKKTEAKPAAN
jgi:hypothetical protein